MSPDAGSAPSRGFAREPLVIFKKVTRSVRRRKISAFAETLSRRVANDRLFCCLLTSDAELKRLNCQFRGIDEATDVLSFPLESKGGGLGDIAISVDRAGTQAEARGHDLNTEICILMLHGVLHLIGLDHDSGRGKMSRIESVWRDHLGLPEGLIERAHGDQKARRTSVQKPAPGGRDR